MAVLVDDPTVPVDNSLSSPASEGAAEFRALKTKLNGLYLNAGIGASFGYLVDTNNKGLNVNITDNSAADNFGSKFKMQRTANAANKSSYGVWAEGILANGVSISAGTLAGLASVTTVGTGCTAGFVYALNSVIYQQSNAFNANITGFYVLFSNRFVAGSAAPGGLGSNQYNRNAQAIIIDSFPRSSSGEYCGWKNGIVFTPESMDRDAVGPGTCLDFSQIIFRAVNVDPRLCYRMTSVIKMAAMQCVVWEAGNNVMTYFDNTTGRWTLNNNGTKRFEVDMNTGTIYRNGVALP